MECLVFVVDDDPSVTFSSARAFLARPVSKVRRGRVMRKIRAGSLAELVRLADQGGVIAATLSDPRSPEPSSVNLAKR